MIAHHAFPDVTLVDIAAELDRENASRGALYPRLIANGRMLEPEAEHGRAIIAAMLADLDRMVPPMRSCAEAHDFSWSDRRQALRRELAQRERHYPRWIAERTLDAVEAARRVHVLSALLWIYEDGFDWRASNGSTPRFAKTRDRTLDEDEALAEWLALALKVGEARHPPQQKELSL